MTAHTSTRDAGDRQDDAERIEAVDRACRAMSAPAARSAIRATAITGTLTRKTEPQKKCSSRKPPLTGPRATARPLVAAQMQMAIARCRASVNTFTRIASVAGKISAAPTPIAARQAISCVGVDGRARPGSRWLRTPTMPSISVPLRPKRSPRLPAASSSPANTSM